MISFPIAYPLSAQKAISYLQMIPLGTQVVITLHSYLISDVLGTYCFLPNVLSLILPCISPCWRLCKRLGVWKRRPPYVQLLVSRAYHHPNLHIIPPRFQKIHTWYMDIYWQSLSALPCFGPGRCLLSRSYVPSSFTHLATWPGGFLIFKSYFKALWSVPNITLCQYK